MKRYLELSDEFGNFEGTSISLTWNYFYTQQLFKTDMIITIKSNVSHILKTPYI